MRPEALYVQVGGKNIAELVTMPVSEAKAFFDQLELDETDAAIAKRLLTEINNRLQFLLDVGLGYLALDRLSASLSGGESQRINLATSLGSSLVGSLYILMSRVSVCIPGYGFVDQGIATVASLGEYRGRGGA